MVSVLVPAHNAVVSVQYTIERMLQPQLDNAPPVNPQMGARNCDQFLQGYKQPTYSCLYQLRDARQGHCEGDQALVVLPG